jgi:Membrane-bound lytic murein transglycosylase
MALLSRLTALIFILSTTASCAVTKTTEDGSGLHPTIYYKPTIHVDLNKCPAPEEQRALLSPVGVVLQTLCRPDYRNCLMQGSCFVDAGGLVKSYNYYDEKDGRYSFVEVDLKRCPFGYGVRGTCLDPFYSVAADLKIYKAGDVIFVPALVGVPVPGGEVHDGYLVIRDAGGAIIGPKRFDFFTGFYSHLDRDNTFARVGLGDADRTFDFRLASEDEAARVRASRAYPRVKFPKVGYE